MDVKEESEALASPAPPQNPRRRIVAMVAVGLGLLACLALAALTAAIDGDEGAGEDAAAGAPRRAQEALGPPCRDVDVGEPCHRHVTWAMQSGIHSHPEWYWGLTANKSTFREFQAVLHADRFADCPMPCGALPPAPAAEKKGAEEAKGGEAKAESAVIGWQPEGQVFAEGQWCSVQAPDANWRLDSCGQGTGARVKVLTYNLFWWNLFGRRGGAGGSAGKLIASHNQGEQYDVMGFQECEDVGRVLSDGGLDGQFEGIPGPHALAMAYRRDAWDKLGDSSENVAEDRRDQWYGKRAGQWVRLRHKATGMTLLFVVHHGPLPVDSGGLCGGEATAYNIMKLIAESAHPGDAIVLVGDFNSGLGTSVVNTLNGPLHKAFSGRSFGGVDHIYSSCPNVVATNNLGGGGSDHDALDAVLQF